MHAHSRWRKLRGCQTAPPSTAPPKTTCNEARRPLPNSQWSLVRTHWRMCRRMCRRSLHTMANVQAQLAYDHATDYRWGAEHAAAVPAGSPTQKVDLSHKDIDELANELYKEATVVNRKTVESALVTRAQQIHHVVAAAVSKALPMRRAAPTPIVVKVSDQKRKTPMANRPFRRRGPCVALRPTQHASRRSTLLHTTSILILSHRV